MSKNDAKEIDIDELDKKTSKPLAEEDISLLTRYGQGPYGQRIKGLETEIDELVNKGLKIIFFFFLCKWKIKICFFSQ